MPSEIYLVHTVKRTVSRKLSRRAAKALIVQADTFSSPDEVVAYVQSPRPGYLAAAYSIPIDRETLRRLDNSENPGEHRREFARDHMPDSLTIDISE